MHNCQQGSGNRSPLLNGLLLRDFGMHYGHGDVLADEAEKACMA